eukprot:6204709-Pleurochrysis_carterae.AAC.1
MCGLAVLLAARDRGLRVYDVGCVRRRGRVTMCTCRCIVVWGCDRAAAVCTGPWVCRPAAVWACCYVGAWAWG